MAEITRRDFVRDGALAVAGAAASLPASRARGGEVGQAPHARILGANDDVRVAVVGFNRQGTVHIKNLRELAGVRLVALCDADRGVLDRYVAEADKLGQPVTGFTDIRKLLESKDLDAIVVATPDHWHCLMTVWGCQAGKDVYVEKPLSHNIFEGRQAVEAAKKYNRIAQWGNGNRPLRIGPNNLEDAKLGKVRVVWTSLARGRQSIGKVTGPQTPPATLDYDLWTGPAPLVPLTRRNLHYDWHWVWPTGTGEIGNNGIYSLDAMRLALGLNTLPRRVLSLGGRFTFDDDGETPNSQIALFQYDPGPLVIFELRNLPSEKGPKLSGPKVRYEQGDAGLPPVRGRTGDDGGFGTGHKGHMFNFVSTVRSRREADLRAPLIEGHLSSTMVHMANISYRLGKPCSLAAAREAIRDQGREVEDVFDGFREHLSVNGVDVEKAEITVGPWLEMDPQTERFVGTSELVTQANVLARGQYRPPFIVPEQV